MHPKESLQIDLARALCITSMMWVHVNPGLSVPSFLNGGRARVVGLVCGEIPGRICVTPLSFISGCLFWHTSTDKPLKQVRRRLALSIYLPVLV